MNNSKDFKYIKGKYCCGEPAHIYFYSDVDSWSVEDFIYEFKYLMNYVDPSEINIHINSNGGNCVDGISVFSLIQDCKIPTKTINDGIAASMASVIWSAGDEQYMRDYAILMIHNPFVESKSADPKTKQVVEAFKKQLSVIYQKRFKLDEETVKEIMDGKEGEDGTFMSAPEAVEKGFVSQSHIIETPQAIKDKIAAVLECVSDPVTVTAKIGAIASVFTQSATKKSNNNQSVLSTQNSKTMNEEIKVVAAILGLTGEMATQEKVSASIKELLGIKNKFDGVQAELAQVKNDLATTQTKLAGSETAVKNLTKNLDEAKASLKVYQDAEAAAQTARIEELVDGAINACKISKESKDAWVNMARADFDTAKSALDSIPAREDISAQIAVNEENQNNAGKAPLTPMEKEVQAKVKSVVGETFKYLEPQF